MDMQSSRSNPKKSPAHSTDAHQKELQVKLRDAAEDGNTDEVIRLLGGGVSVDATDEDGRSPLWTASGNGHYDVVKKLIEAGANINQTDKVSVASMVFSA
eukprot:Em0010g26a